MCRSTTPARACSAWRRWWPMLRQTRRDASSAVERFVATAAADEARIELVFGLSGSLLGCGLLLDAVGLTPGEEENLLTSLGNDLSRRLLDRLSRLPVIVEATESEQPGRGTWLCGHLLCAAAMGAGLESRRPERPASRASNSWPDWRGRSVEASGGRCRHRAARTWDGMRARWCNGAAGHLHLWLLAYELLGDPRYLQLAEGAAWTSYEAQSTGGDLCCGSAGRAYALLALLQTYG